MSVSFVQGDRVWVDEGDSAGCCEFGGTIERVRSDGTFEVLVESQAIFAGAATGTLRHVDPLDVDVDHWNQS